MNATRSHTWASVLVRLPNSLLILPAAALSIFPIKQTLDFVLGTYLGLMVLVVLVGLVILTRIRPIGRRHFTWRERLSGIVFLFTQSSYQLPDQGVVALGGGLLAPSEIAAYGAISPILKPFDLLTDVFRSILTTELIDLRARSLRRTVTRFRMMALSLAVLAILSGPTALEWIYDGRYSDNVAMIPWLAIGGFFRLIEVFPRSHLIGQSDQDILHRFVLWQLVVAGAVLTIGAGFVLSRGVIAIAWSMAAIQIGRFVVSQAHYLRWSHRCGGTLTLSKR